MEHHHSSGAGVYVARMQKLVDSRPRAVASIMFTRRGEVFSSPKSRHTHAKTTRLLILGCFGFFHSSFQNRSFVQFICNTLKK